jgi:predicted nucleic acid-binding protein
VSSWFLDASVFLASEDPDDANHDDARRLIGGRESLATLDLAWYEVTNVAICSWKDDAAARRLWRRVSAVGDDGGIARADLATAERATELAHLHGLSVYDAAYAAAAESWGRMLVSCDVRDLVSKGLARLPRQALAEGTGSQPAGAPEP